MTTRHHNQAKDLLRQAFLTHGIVVPCTGRTRLRDCFTEHRGELLFWFNDTNKSTHLLSTTVMVGSHGSESPISSMHREHV